MVMIVMVMVMMMLVVRRTTVMVRMLLMMMMLMMIRALTLAHPSAPTSLPVCGKSPAARSYQNRLRV